MKYVFVDFDETLYLHSNKPLKDSESLDDYYRSSGGLLNEPLLNVFRRTDGCQFIMLSWVGSNTERDAKARYLTEVVSNLFTQFYGSGPDKAAWVSQWCKEQNVNPKDCILIDDNANGNRSACRMFGISFYTPLYITLLNWLPIE